MLKFILPRLPGTFDSQGVSGRKTPGADYPLRYQKRAPAANQGFSMIEVLVSILLVSVGLLGAAAMYARAVEFSSDTERRQMAAMLANELMEVMRSDIARVLDAKGKPKADLGGYAKAANVELVPSKASECTDVLPVSVNDRMACWAGRAQSVMP